MKPVSAVQKSLIIFTIMLAAILEVLDSTIVNIALPNMMPSLSADQDQITWVLTSYVVAAAMMLPLTGFLSQRFGVKKLLIIDITGFMISSFACGTANTLTSMVFYRLLQGGFGAALIPLSQAILRESFPLEEQGKAMAIWGLGIMVAPVFGPSLGGYILTTASWRWIFYLNTPICFFGLLMTLWVIPASTKTRRHIDYLGVLLMFTGIGCLQVFLDQGNSRDWFSSNLILLLAIISVAGIVLFILRTRAHPNPVITFVIFRDRNFTLCTILLTAFCGFVFAFFTLEPVMLESLFGYTPLAAGNAMIAMGLASAVGMSLSPTLMKYWNIKYILTFGLAASSIAGFYFAHLNGQATHSMFSLGNALFGFGIGLFMVPITTYSLATLPEHYITEAAGLFSYGRMLGTSTGISLLSTLAAREAQINWVHINQHLNATNPNVTLWLQEQHLSLHHPKTLIILQELLSSQAHLIGFLDAYYLIGWCLLLLVPLVFCLKRVVGITTDTH